MYLLGASKSSETNDQIHREIDDWASGEVTTADQVSAIRLNDRYRTVPRLEGEAYEGLRESIRLHGMDYDPHLDENGVVIDGDARVRAARELGITDYTVVVHKGLSQEDGRDLSLRLNCVRRHLTQAQRREILTREIKRDPARDTRTLGTLCGVSRQTALSRRDKLIESGEVEEPDHIIGRDGKRHPVRKPRAPRVIVPSAADVGETLADLEDLETAELSEGAHTADEVSRLAGNKRKRMAGRQEAPEADDPGRNATEDADSGHIDLIISDGRDAEGDPVDHEELVELAVRELRSGAFIATTVPNGGLMALCTAADGRLEEVGRFAEILPSPIPIASPVPVDNTWRLTLLFQKSGKSQKHSLVRDSLLPDGDEYDPRPLLRTLIGAYTHPGDSVLNASASDDVAQICSETGRRCVASVQELDESDDGDSGERTGESGEVESSVVRPAIITPRSPQLTIEWASPDVVAILSGGEKIAHVPVERTAKSSILKPGGNRKVNHAGIINGLSRFCGRAALPHDRCDRPCYADEDGCGGCYANDGEWHRQGHNVAVDYDVIYNGIVNDRATIRIPKGDDWSLDRWSGIGEPPLWRIDCQSADGAASVALGLMQRYAAANPDHLFHTFCSHGFRPSDEALEELAALHNTWCLHSLSGWFSPTELDVRFASFERYIDAGVASVAYLVTSSDWDSEAVLSRALDLVPPELVIEEPRKLNGSSQEEPRLGVNPLGRCSQTKCSRCPLQCGLIPLTEAGLIGDARADDDPVPIELPLHEMEVASRAN